VTPEGILATEREQELARTMMHAAFALTHEHEATEHAGEPCLEQRAGTIAYVAHHLGLTTEHLALIALAIASYDEQHEKGAE
jgi:hypothetical protein